MAIACEVAKEKLAQARLEGKDVRVHFGPGDKGIAYPWSSVSLVVDKLVVTGQGSATINLSFICSLDLETPAKP